MKTLRHHAVHPVSAVKPNLAVNQKPNYVPPERAALPPPNPNPSLGPVVGLDAANARLRRETADDDSDCDGPNDSDCDGEGDRKNGTSVY